MAWIERPEMKRFDPSGGIPEGPHAITRLDQAQRAMAQLSAAAFGAAYAAEPGTIPNDAPNAHSTSFKRSRSIRNTGRA
jgi:hypothetical protein